MADSHIHRIRNSSAKAARIARAVVELKTITTEDITDGILKEHGVRSALLRSIRCRNHLEATSDKRVGDQRWNTASEEIWAQVEIIASCFLEDVEA